MHASDDPDEDVRRACAGDDDALARALRAAEPELRAAVSLQPLYRRDLEVDDLLQVSYVEAFVRIASLRDRTADGFRAWMRRLVDTNLKDAIRALERDKRPDARRRVTHDGSGASARTLFARVAGAGGSPSGVNSAAEEVRRLEAALERLPADYRHVVREVDLAERRVAEVAAEMGRSAGAVHLLVKRAHDRLRELLAEHA